MSAAGLVRFPDWTLGLARRLYLPAVILLAGCANEPVALVPAVLEVTLSTPNGDDGALLFTVTGGPVDTVESVGNQLYWARSDANTLRVIVTGELRSGALARLRIADDRYLSQYHATINQVARRSTYSQREPGSYSLTLTP